MHRISWEYFALIAVVQLLDGGEYIAPPREIMASEPTALDEWASIIAAHKESRRDYLALLGVAQTDPNQQDEADGALRRLMALEAFALRQPATSPASFRFKLQLWADGRVEGLEQEWKIFSSDCERLLERQATPDARRTKRL